MAHIVDTGVTLMDGMSVFRNEGLARSCEGWYEDRSGGSALPVLFGE